MAAPMISHTGSKNMLKATANLRFRCILKQNCLHNSIRTYFNRSATNVTETEKQTQEEKDFYGVDEYFDTNPTKSNPEKGLSKKDLITKYDMADKPRLKPSLISASYGMVRVDPGVSNRFIKSQEHFKESNANKPIRRRHRHDKKSVETQQSSLNDSFVSKDMWYNNMPTKEDSEHFNDARLSDNPSNGLEQMPNRPLQNEIKKESVSYENTTNRNDDLHTHNETHLYMYASSLASGETNFIDEQYFENVLDKEKTKSEDSQTEKLEQKVKSSEYSFIDEHYFGEAKHIVETLPCAEKSDENSENYQDKSSSKMATVNSTPTEDDIIHDQFLLNSVKDSECKSVKLIEEQNSYDCPQDTNFIYDQYFPQSKNDTRLDYPTGLEAPKNENEKKIMKDKNDHENMKNIKQRNIKENKEDVDIEKTDSNLHLAQNQYNDVNEVKPNLMTRKKQEYHPMSTAEEAAKDIRAEISQRSLGSKKKRQNKDLVKTLGDMTSSELTTFLYDNIVYNKGDIIAVNKPYGIPSIGSQESKRSIADCLEKLKHRIDPDLTKLHLITHLDRDTTGCILLAKTDQMAFRLTEACKKNQVIKKYLTVTKGIPTPPQGVIDIPIKEGKVGKSHRMVLHTSGSKDGARKAVTQYKVLSSSYSTAFVECIPSTSVKHQIRAHMFYGLNTPILGDHKYSHYTKLAPQKLFSETLNGLRLRQAEVRDLPLHLHCWSLVIPEFENGQNLHIRCRLPFFFVRNMKRLKIDFKDHL